MKILAAFLASMGGLVALVVADGRGRTARREDFAAWVETGPLERRARAGEMKRKVRA